MSLSELKNVFGRPPRKPDLAAKNALAVRTEEGSFYTACAYCHEEIRRIGEDALDYCENCGVVEGQTIEIEED